jgi:hypothetical protein
MSGEISVDVHFKFLIALADKFKDDRCVFLFLVILADQEVVGCGFGAGFVQGHVNDDFIGYFSLFLDLYGEAGENCGLFAFDELLFDGDGGVG